MADPLSTITTRRTPQTERTAPEQIPNAAGGYGFQVGDEARVLRFLTLGVDGGTYYASERELTKANAEVVLRLARERGAWLVGLIEAVSVAGRAPRQNPALFALAAVAGLGDGGARAAALAAIPSVCRTGTHLFVFAGYVEQFRGWGRGLRRAIGQWYTRPDVDQVAYQTVKYRQRDGWTHRDLLRLAHPEPSTDAHRDLFRWIVGGADQSLALPEIVRAYRAAQGTTDPEDWRHLTLATSGLSWEMLPDAALARPEVWAALIAKGMPQTALMRQLPRLTRLDVFEDRAIRAAVCTQLQDLVRLQRARVHPINVLIAQRTYASGRGKGSTWTPDRAVVDALDAAFYAAFRAVEPTEKRILLALDVSGSMGSPVGGLPISCREAAAALALVTLASEPTGLVDVVGFTAGRPAVRGYVGRRGWESALTYLDITPRRRLDDVCSYTASLQFGGTDCALPMLWANEQGKDYDAFVILTDNETWHGQVHPHQALQQYRERRVPGARLAVVGMTATDVSIADPADPGSLDVAGFDSAAPTLLADFIAGRV